jgi:hypothetical protein
MGTISFWLVALGLPLAAVLGNSLTRLIAELPQSAPADMILALVVFDAIVAIQAHDFKHHMQYEEFQASLPAIYVLLIIVGMFLWGVSVFFCEKQIVKYYRWTTRRFSQFPFFAFFLSLLFPIILFFASVAPFVYKG